MKIKIKVRTLIFLICIFAIIFIWIVPATLLGIADYLENRNSDKAIMFYEKYASYPTTSGIERKFTYAVKLTGGFNKYTIFSDGWGGLSANPENLEKSKELFTEIIHSYSYKKSEKQFFADSYKMLMDIAIATGDTEMLHEWISFGQQYEDGEIKYISHIYNGFLLHVNGDNEAAEKIISEYEDTEFADVKLDILKMEIAFLKENYSEVESISEKINNIELKTRNKVVFGSSKYYDRGFWLNRFDKIIKGNNKIKGTVTYKGEPMPFVEVYIQEPGGGVRTNGDSYAAITDEKGEFQTIGLKDGLYSVGIGLDSSLLKDKELSRSGYGFINLEGSDENMNFVFNDTISVYSPKPGEKIPGNEFGVSWEEVEGAAYYTVQAVIFSNPYENDGNSVTISISDKNGNTNFTVNYAEFDISRMNEKLTGLSYEGEEEILGYEGVLGIFLPGIKYPITVKACDEDGNVITGSLPMLTYYKLIPSITAGGSLKEGQTLILSNNYPGAIKYYEDILTEEPTNTDALKYLTRIYGLGWKKGEKNIERATELGLKYAEITGSPQLLFSVLDTMGKNEIKENRELIYSAIKKADGKMSMEGYRLLGRCYIADENWECAREAFIKIDGYVPYELFYLNLYFGDYAEAAENLKKLYTSEMTTNKIIESLRALADDPPEDSDREALNSFLLKLLRGVEHTEGEALYNQTASQIKNQNIKKILHGIYLEKNWDVTY